MLEFSENEFFIPSQNSSVFVKGIFTVSDFPGDCNILQPKKWKTYFCGWKNFIYAILYSNYIYIIKRKV